MLQNECAKVQKCKLLYCFKYVFVKLVTTDDVYREPAPYNGQRENIGK